MEAYLRGVLSAPPWGPCKFSWLSLFWSNVNLESPSVPGENLGFCLSWTLFFHEGHDKQQVSLLFQASGQFLKPQLTGDGSVVLLAAGFMRLSQFWVLACRAPAAWMPLPWD